MISRAKADISPCLMRLIILTGLVCWLASGSPQYPIPEDTAITMQRGNCEGGCPVYRVVIFANGDVIWQGSGRVSKLGVVLSRIEPEQLRALIDGFQSIDYFHLENIYGYRGGGCRSSKPDMPMVITSFAMGGLSKTVTHHDGCVGDVSDKLTAIENSIDKTVNTARWISGRPPATKNK